MECEERTSGPGCSTILHVSRFEIGNDFNDGKSRRSFPAMKPGSFPMKRAVLYLHVSTIDQTTANRGVMLPGWRARKCRDDDVCCEWHAPLPQLGRENGFSDTATFGPDKGGRQ